MSLLVQCTFLCVCVSGRVWYIRSFVCVGEEEGGGERRRKRKRERQRQRELDREIMCISTCTCICSWNNSIRLSIRLSPNTL